MVDRRNHERYQGFQAKFDACTVVLEPLSRNTYILLVSNDPRIETGAMLYNIHRAQAHVAEFGAGKIVLERKCG